MNWAEMCQAVESAKTTMNMGDAAIRGLLQMARGRLETSGVSGYVLADLKRELTKFNSHTHEWHD